MLSAPDRILLIIGMLLLLEHFYLECELTLIFRFDLVELNRNLVFMLLSAYINL